MFKWLSNFFKGSKSNVLDLSNIDIVITPKMTIDMTNHINDISINEGDSLETKIDAKNTSIKLKEIDVEVIKINGVDVTDDLLELAIRNRELY